MVLSRRQQHHAFAVAEREDGYLRPLEAFLQHQSLPCAAEASCKGFADRCCGFLEIFSDGDPLAGGQTIGFHHQGAFQLFQQLQAFVGACRGPVPCGRNPGVPHQCLGPGLARFQLGTIGAGSKHRQPCIAQTVGNSSGQGGFRADHHQVDRLLTTGFDQAFSILFTDRQ